MLAVALIANSLSAQHLTDSLHKLPEVVVTEHASQKHVRSTAPIQQLNATTLTKLNAIHVSDAVKHFSGVIVKDYGGIGGLKTLSVRNMGANHTAISYDGVAVTDIQNGQIDIGRFSLQNVEMLSLNNGQNDQIFQAARLFASASVLTIQTKRPSFANNKTMEGTAVLKVGSLGLISPSVATSFRLNDNWSLSASAEWLKAKGDYRYTLQYGADSASVEKRNNTDVENLLVESALFYTNHKQAKAHARIYYYQSERGLPGATVFYNTQYNNKQRLFDNTFFVQGYAENAISPTLKWQANAKYNAARVRYLDPEFLSGEQVLDERFNQNEWYGSFAMLYRPIANLSVNVATDLSHGRLTSNRTPFDTPSRWLSQSVVAGKYVTEQLTVIANMLYTQTFESVKQGTPANNQQKWSPYISFSVQPWQSLDLRFRAFYKNIFRLPTFNDLYYPSTGKRTLLPEDVNQLNLGVSYTASFPHRIKHIMISADAYHNNVSNKIVAYPDNNLFIWSMYNLGKVSINGMDVNAEMLAQLSSQITLSAGATYSLQDARDKTNPTSALYNHKIPYSPLHAGSGRLSLATPWVDFGYSVVWSGKRYYMGYNKPQYEMMAYADHNITLAKDWTTSLGRVTLSAEVLNILNNNYQLVRNYPMPGRSYRTSISIHF